MSASNTEAGSCKRTTLLSSLAFITGVSPAAEWSPGFSLNRCLHIREVIREGKQPPLDRNSTPTEKLNS
jgi:hypothetical protein